MSLSPAAHGLYADLCLLTRLPLPTFDGIVGADAAAVSIDAVKERVFGSVEGPPRTERESVERYILAIVRAFSASGARSIDDFDEEVKRLIESGTGWRAAWNTADSERANLAVERDTFISQRDDALDDLRRVREEYDAVRHERDDLREACETMRKERDDARAAVHPLMTAKDAEIEHLRAEHKDLVIVRRRLIDVESEGNRLRTEIAKLRDSAHALTTERDRLAARVREHEETLNVLRNVNADLFKAQQELREARDESKRWHDYSESLHLKLEQSVSERDALKACRATDKEVWTEKTKRIETLNTALTHAREEAKAAHDALTAEQGRTERLRAVMVDLIADLNAAKEGAE